MLRKHTILGAEISRLMFWKTMIALDPNARRYTDSALAPVSDDGDVTLDLLTKTTGIQAALSHQKKVAQLT